MKINVPSRISRAVYVEMIESLGLNPHDLRSLELRMDGVYAEVMARGDDGKILVDSLANEVIAHRIFIPIADGDLR